MIENPIIRISLITIGIMMVVGSTFSIVGGINQMNAAQQWEKTNTNQECYTYVNSSMDIDNASREEIEKNIRNNTERECFESKPTSNPYSGGQTSIMYGLVFATFGGTCTYFGIRDSL